MMSARYATFLALALLEASQAFAPPSPVQQMHQSATTLFSHSNRRDFMSYAAVAIGGAVSVPFAARADVDTDAFLSSGQVAMPMGVSGQAGKTKPVTGIILREGSDVSRDSRNGNVLAEILLGKSDNLTPV